MPPPLGVHSMWIMADGSVVEVLGILRFNGTVSIRIWQPVGGPLYEGCWLRIADGCLSRGAGTTTSAKFEDLFAAPEALRILSHPDELMIIGGHTEVVRRVLNWAPTSRPVVYDSFRNAPSPIARSLARAMKGQPYTAFTDGSYKEFPSTAECLFSEPAKNVPSRSEPGAVCYPGPPPSDCSASFARRTSWCRLRISDGAYPVDPGIRARHYRKCYWPEDRLPIVG